MSKSHTARAFALALAVCVPIAAQAQDANRAYNLELSACYKAEADDRAAICTGKVGKDLASCTTRVAGVRQACLDRASQRLADAVRTAQARERQRLEYEAARAQRRQPR